MADNRRVMTEQGACRLDPVTGITGKTDNDIFNFKSTKRRVLYPALGIFYSSSAS